MNRIIATSLMLLISGLVIAQTFTYGDTLRGTLLPERSCYDITFYDLSLRVNPADSTIAGSNVFHFNVIR